MIRVSVSRADATVTETETLTAGRVGLECGFAFSTEWDGLLKIAVFEGAETIEVALGRATVAVVPPECMATPGYALRVGVYGLSPANAIVIPTVWAKAGKIKDSAAPDDESFAPATPELVAQILGASQDAIEIARSVQERANNGEFDGTDGTSPTVRAQRVEDGVEISITDVNGTTEAKLNDGTNGVDGVSPGITITDIEGGHRVTITDAEHPQGQSFDVMDGEDGEGGGSTITVDNALSDSSTNPVQNKVVKAALDGKGTYSKPSGGIPASDLASAVQTSLGKADTALQSVPSTYRTAAEQDVIDAGKASKITEVTIATTGAVTQALDAGKIYHFTGALTALSVSLNAPASGELAQYHFDFNSGSAAPTLTMPNTVTMPDSFSVEANKHYEVDILNSYGVVISWANS